MVTGVLVRSAKSASRFPSLGKGSGMTGTFSVVCVAADVTAVVVSVLGADSDTVVEAAVSGASVVSGGAMVSVASICVETGAVSEVCISD